ncbi:MAG: NADH:flavin oxidoreductase [Candidatus Eremiobacteraeota bacterium]|nr:NADH:flavin oxidoreductase [Candidatus Eremiobacteraeota bacterium]
MSTKAGVHDALFRPYTIRDLTLRNRIVMAPMTRSKSPGSVPGPDVAAYYRRRAENEVGLIVTEGTTVDHPVSSMDVDIPNFYGDALAGWRRVVEEVHAVGGAIAPQLWHVGSARRADGKVHNPDVPSASPSGYSRPGKRFGDPMTDDDIRSVVRGFADGARNAREIGFDAIEIHGAHGYLIDQFFWEGLNDRDDAYGGSAAARGRFAVDIVEAIRKEVGDDYPIIFRFSQWKQQDYDAKLARTPEELGAFLAPLSAAGVDAFHCSQRRFWEPEFEGSDLNLAGWTKKLTGKPSITVGSVGLTGEFISAFAGESSEAAPIDDLVARVERGEFDLVAVGRALLVDAAWARKIHEGRTDELAPFTREALATLS